MLAAQHGHDFVVALHLGRLGEEAFDSVNLQLHFQLDLSVASLLAGVVELDADHLPVEDGRGVGVAFQEGVCK